MRAHPDNNIAWKQSLLLWLIVIVLLQVPLILLLTLTDVWDRFLYLRPSEETFGIVVLVSSLIGCCWTIRKVHGRAARWYWNSELASQQQTTTKPPGDFVSRVVSQVFTGQLLVAGAYAGGLCGLILGLLVTMTDETLFENLYVAIINTFVCTYLGAFGGAIFGPIVATIYKAASLETKPGPPLTVAEPIRRKKPPVTKSRGGKILIQTRCNVCRSDLTFTYRDRGSVQVCFKCFAYVDVPSRPFDNPKGSTTPIDLIQAIVKKNKENAMKILESNPEYISVCPGASAHLMKQALLGNQSDMMRFLIAHGADPNERDSDGNTPLMAASAEGQIEIVELLLDNKVAIDERNNLNHTALEIACITGHLDVVKALINSGADMSPGDNGSSTPRDIADRAQHPHIAKFIEKVENTKHVNS